VLLAPPNPQTGELVTAEHLRAILELMRQEFDYVVVDTQSSFQDRALAVLDTADRIVTLLTLEITCIKNIKLYLEVADLLEYPKEKTLLVLNKAEGGKGIKAEDVEANIQHKLALQIANAPADFVFSINRGVPLVIEKRNHQASQDIFRLAGLLSNKARSSETGAKKNEKTSEASRGLFGRLIAKR
jgi:pilus assembly protein CpaE